MESKMRFFLWLKLHPKKGIMEGKMLFFVAQITSIFNRKKNPTFYSSTDFQASSDGGSHTDEETCSLGNFDVQTWMCLR